jgi:protein ImuB
VLDRLDRAWGWAPDPREALVAPAHFHSQLELHARTEQLDTVLAGARLLLTRLSAWAGAQQRRVQALSLSLHHETRLHARANNAAEAARHSLHLALAEPGNDPEHWCSLLRERLAREPLKAAVIGLSLHCEAMAEGVPPDTALFPDASAQRESLLRLLERLQARLGPEGVQTLAPLADHRPEHATARTSGLDAAVARSSPSRRNSPAQPPPGPPGAPEPSPDQRPRLTRPVWLLKAPRPLPERASTPWLDGQALRLLGGPERIETGWWDSHEPPVMRDYFIAQTTRGALAWVFRPRPAPPAGEPGWFLHGWFG